jgi:hypothetical protein
MAPRDDVRSLQLPAAIERFQSYVAAGKFIELRGAFARKSISPSTMRNWINNPKKLLTSYRRSEFTDAIGTLPDLERKKRNDAYEFALKELGVGIDGQHDLESYDGIYRFVHDFPEITLNNFVIKVERSPFVVMFAFKYSNRDGRRGKCDGLIVSRHGRLVCAGFSPTTMFQAVFRIGGSPEKDLIRGMAFIEDVNSQQVCFSTVVMTREENTAPLRDAEKIARDTGRTL